MFEHLQAEEFVNLIENDAISAQRRAHVESCARCRQTWKSLQRMYTNVSTLEDDVLEPDWSEFRDSVRDAMLSRAVRRQTAGRRWALWPLQPAAVWAFSLFMGVGVVVGAFVWTRNPAEPGPVTTTVESVAPSDASSIDSLIELQGIETEMTAWSSHSVFEEIATMESDEAENLLQLLQTEGEGAFRGQ
jgi:hypothetical protein